MKSTLNKSYESDEIVANLSFLIFKPITILEIYSFHINIL